MASGFNLVREPSRRIEEDEREGRIPQRGAVGRVSKEWRVHEDGAMAHKLQEEENRQHYSRNRDTRQTVHSDIIDARIVQHEEELRQQEDKMREIEEKQRIAQRDAAFAQRLLSEEEDEEDRARRMLQEDERLARQLSEDVVLDEEDVLKRQEQEDQRVARELQLKEQRRFERYKEKKRERELERTRKRLEREIATDRQEVLPSGESEEGEPIWSGQQQRVRAADGRLEDVGDFSDFYAVPPDVDDVTARRYQEQQDEELARLLQEQEHKVGKH